MERDPRSTGLKNVGEFGCQSVQGQPVLTDTILMLQPASSQSMEQGPHIVAQSFTQGAQGFICHRYR
jgi:hypothetical protein